MIQIHPECVDGFGAGGQEPVLEVVYTKRIG
jgi:hypothetical protein